VPAKVCQLFAEFGEENSNKLTKAQARELYKNFASGNQNDFPMFKDWFNAIDKNKNNSLSKKELREYLYAIEVEKGTKF
jgi:Ca2+-binding EF-hand superfamily protein